MNNRIVFRSIGVIVILVIAIGVKTYTAQAQELENWSLQQQIPDYDDLTETPPFIVADQNRTVHAFNSQTIDGERLIVYRQWSLEKGWTSPIDIFMHLIKVLNYWIFF